VTKPAPRPFAACDATASSRTVVSCDAAQTYDARQSRYKAERGRFVQETRHPEIVYEPGKCIDCGICIQIASSHGEKLGLAFVGRGFDVRVAVPFGESLAEGLKVAAAECVKACPTGAMAFKR